MIMMHVLYAVNWDILPMVKYPYYYFYFKTLIEGAVVLPIYYYYDYSVTPIIFDLNCTGTEEAILDCPYIERGSYSCSNYYDAAVICQSM